MQLKDEPIQKFFQLKVPNFPACKSCGQSQWTYNNTVFDMKEYMGGGQIPILPGKVFPAVLVTCNNCGYVMMYNAVVAGLLDQSGNPIE
jgi:hypothetical protein